jgi:hypothetical protein
VHAASDGPVKEGSGCRTTTQTLTDACIGDFAPHHRVCILLQTNSSAERSIHMLLISSDAVFDGSQPPYTPGHLSSRNMRLNTHRSPLPSPAQLTHVAEHAPSPVTPHGTAKALAEQYVTSALQGAATILRVPVLYGRITRSLRPHPPPSPFPSAPHASQPQRIARYLRHIKAVGSPRRRRQHKRAVGFHRT